MLGPQLRRASMVCGLGLESVAPHGPCPSWPLWEGTVCHCPAGAVLDFSRVFWGRLWSLIPIGSATCGNCLLTPGLLRSVLNESLGGFQTPLGLWLTALLALQSPFTSLFIAVVPKGQASRLSSYRTAIQLCLLRLRAEGRGGDLPKVTQQG